jgi:hypothetical protein
VIRRAFALLVVACGLTLPMGGRADDPKKDKEKEKDAPVRVTVVVILATTENNVVDKKLTDLAAEVQKRSPELVGFKLSETLQKSVPVGDSHTFDLLEKQTLQVTIDKPKDKTGRVGLTVTPPGGEAVSYTCACDKFFPLVTTYKTKEGKKLIVAIGAKPCTGVGP